MKGRRVLVTGGSGFIGSHLVHRLLDDGAIVAVAVRYANVMKNQRLRPIWDRIEVIEADVRNRGALAEARRFDPEVVFHLAAYNHVGQSFVQVEECFDVNAKGTANVVDIFADVERIVYASTSEVYGAQDRTPFVESMSPNPISPYAITKYAGELYCRMRQRAERRGASMAIVRPFNTFGPYQSAKAVIPELIIDCLLGRTVRTTQGLQTREFNFVGNTVDGMIKAALHPGQIEGPVNLGSGHDIAIRDLVKRVAELTATRSKLEIGALPDRPTEIWRMSSDATRAKTLLGWQPQTSFDDGLKITVQWFRRYLEACDEMTTRFNL